MNNRRRLSMFISLIVFIVSLSLVAAALFTDYWSESRPINKKFNSVNNYVHLGLFKGSRQLDWGLGPRYKPFSVYQELHDRVGFVSKVPWVFILFFLAFGILWNAVGAIVSLLNTVAKETDTVAGPKGIYLWSILAAVSYASALITFLIQYVTTIQTNVLLSEHISSGFSTENRTRLSFSFYFVTAALILLLIPCLLVYGTSSSKRSRIGRFVGNSRCTQRQIVTSKEKCIQNGTDVNTYRRIVVLYVFYISCFHFIDSFSARCNFSWNGPSPLTYPFLPLHIGEKVTVACSCDEWSYGSSLDNGNRFGIFPNNAVMSFNESVPSISNEAIEIVEELTDILKEWWHTVKNTYYHQARMECQDEVLVYMEDIMVMRKKILSGNVPIEELREMRSELARKIDLGNQWLGLDMLIRDDMGRKMDSDSTSVVQIYRAHVDAAIFISLVQKPNDSPGVTAFSLLVHALSATVDSKAECEFTLSLYDTSEKKFISESFVFYWSFSTGNLTNRNSKVLFNDLGSKEYPSSSSSVEAHRLLLCIRVARIAPIEQTSSTLKKHVDPGPPQLWPRQPYAAAVLDLSNVIGDSHGATEHIISLNRDDSLEQLIARANTARTTFGRAQLMISTEVLLGSLTQIKKMHPQIFSSNPPLELRKLSFADVISADDIRNDLYVTLLQGDLHGGKGSDKNIEVRITVVDTNGIVENSIVMITADGIRWTTTYQSLVFYHDDKPKWNEAIKVQIPENIDQNIHLRITFHHKKTFDKAKQEKGPFALAFARIMEGATLIKDGLHELLVYKIETGRFDDNDTSYTRLPATREELKASQAQLRPQTTTFVYGEKNFLTIETVTCSTTLTHNKSLLDILRWKQNRSNLKERLEEISRPKFLAVGEELVKFIPNFCDALFEILDHYPDYDSLVFDDLVTLVQLVKEERYKNFRPVLDKYVENFHSTVAFLKLLPVLRERIENAEDTHERSLNTMKSLGTLIKLIVRSKLCSDRLGMASNNFQFLIDELLEAFVVFMQNKRVRMTCQNMALKHIPAIIPHLTYYDVYNSDDLTNFLVRLMDHLGENISSRCRLNFLKDVVQTEHFIQEENRKKLLPKIIEKVVEELETSGSVHLQDVVCDQIKMDECISASADIMFYIIERLFCSTDAVHGQGSEEELYLIVWKSFRTIVQTTIVLINAKYSASVFCALTIAMLSKLSAQMYKLYLDSHATRIDKHDLLMELVHLFRDLINKSPFPCSWFQMILLQDRY
uniref:C2 DOCK-type domain-containing protein n=1 Tax=Elaeophora elaphi TaxID=1147741 RepID=A0A0R3S2B9_9BILA